VLARRERGGAAGSGGTGSGGTGSAAGDGRG